MRFIFTIFVFLFLAVQAHAQLSNGFVFIKDTLRLPEVNNVLEGESVSAILKKGSSFKLFKTSNNKYYFKIIVSENLYFNKKDALEILSGTKSIYFKDAVNYELDDHTGFYLVEVLKNYVGTLKDEGVTSIVFNNTETTYTKKECNQVKQMAKYFYESISAKK
jgi:hypothetical protein